MQPSEIRDLRSPLIHRVSGRLSLFASCASLVLILLGDPLWLALPAALVSVALGGWTLRNAPSLASAHIGVAWGILNVLLWMLIILLLQQMLDAPLMLEFSTGE